MTKECRRRALRQLLQGSLFIAALICLIVCDVAETRAQQHPSPAPGRAVLLPPRLEGPMPHGTAVPTLIATPQRADVYPIDLPTALRLAGANNLQIARAAARIDEARARLAGSQAAWWPSLYGGAGYTRHNGQIQDTRGEVIEVTRSSLFVGGGPALGNTISGGASSPRLGMDFSLTDALFRPLVERQLVQAANASFGATYNDTLLQVSLGYLDLIRAQGQTSIAKEAVKNAQSLVDLVGNRVKAKSAPPADGLRVQAELAERRRQLFQAEESVRVVSAELVRLLRLDPTTVLMPADDHALPLAFVNESFSLAELINQGVASRPEVAERQAVANATAQRSRQEQWRPLIPSVSVGLSAGGFGGGENAFFGNFRDRADFDALLVWQLQNFGFGNRALRRERAAQTQQATLATAEVGDLVAAEVAAAYHQVHFRKKQIDAARDQVQAAEKAVPLNFLGIKGEVLRAIEAQQAIQALASARFQYLSAITDYNRAQFLLLRAVGQPLDPSKDRR